MGLVISVWWKLCVYCDLCELCLVCVFFLIILNVKKVWKRNLEIWVLEGKSKYEIVGICGFYRI